MTISVIIPAYNCQTTIVAALESVFAQTLLPDEIIVIDDGSTDHTSSILKSYAPRITILEQSNSGVSRARNRGCQAARGDLLAFLDSDDLWHPRYLEFQLEQCRKYPDAVAYYTGHINIRESDGCRWNDYNPMNHTATVLSSVNFLKEYNARPGPFACITHCCVPKQIVQALGAAPFPESLPIVQDLYFCNRFGMLGDVVYSTAPLTAYRVRAASLSSNRRRVNEDEVRAFEILLSQHVADDEQRAILRQGLAMKRRLLAKTLIELGEVERARRQLIQSLRDWTGLVSVTKSGGLLLLTHLPRRLRPTLAAKVRACEYGNEHP